MPVIGAGGAVDSEGNTARVAWYAIQVKTNWERPAAGLLENKGYEIFLPVRRVKRRWSDRTKEIEIPLFSGYLFGHFDLKFRLPILTTPAVFSIVAAGKEHLPVPDSQIADIQRLLISGVPILPAPYLEVGQWVVIDGGPLDGQRGVLTRIKNTWRVVVSVDVINQAVAVEVDRDQVRVIDAKEPGRPQYYVRGA